MEESESRRERLKSMRAVAAEAEASGNPGPTGVLANPLLETPTPPHSAGAQRFDFYTDPMAAFSANKRPTQDLSAPRNPAMSSYPPMPMRDGAQAEAWRGRPPYGGMNPPPYLTNQGYGRDSNYGGRGDWRHGGSGGNVGFNPPYPMNQGSGGNSNYRGRGDWRGGGSGGVNHPYPMNQGFGGNSNHGGGGGEWRSGVVHQNFRQGRGQWRGNSPNQGVPRGGGRGRGFRFHGSVEDETKGPERYYDKSMAENPWQNLQPVVWKGLDATNSTVSKYVSMKKPRIMEPSRGEGSSTQQQSLAAYLAASFNEAAHDASSV